MLNPFFIIYIVFLIGFLLGVGAVVYHLVKYQLNRKVTVITTAIFLFGVAILLIINLVAAIGIRWGRYSIDF